jgi:hypothetical protein
VRFFVVVCQVKLHCVKSGQFLSIIKMYVRREHERRGDEENGEQTGKHTCSLNSSSIPSQSTRRDRVPRAARSNSGSVDMLYTLGTFAAFVLERVCGGMGDLLPRLPGPPLSHTRATSFPTMLAPCITFLLDSESNS